VAGRDLNLPLVTGRGNAAGSLKPAGATGRWRAVSLGVTGGHLNEPPQHVCLAAADGAEAAIDPAEVSFPATTVIGDHGQITPSVRAFEEKFSVHVESSKRTLKPLEAFERKAEKTVNSN
jgi:hypothetical protein